MKTTHTTHTTEIYKTYAAARDLYARIKWHAAPRDVVETEAARIAVAKIAGAVDAVTLYGVYAEDYIESVTRWFDTVKRTAAIIGVPEGMAH